MPHYDISKTLELPTTVSASFLREHLIAVLRSLQVESNMFEGGIVEFHVPWDNSTKRGYRLRSISYGQIKLIVVNNRCKVMYQIIIGPIRFLSMFFIALAFAYLLAYITAQYAHPEEIIILLFFSGFVYVAGKATVSWKFDTFIRSIVNRGK